MAASSFKRFSRTPLSSALTRMPSKKASTGPRKPASAVMAAAKSSPATALAAAAVAVSTAAASAFSAGSARSDASIAPE